MAPYKEDFQNGHELATLPILEDKPMAVRWAIGMLVIFAGAGVAIVIGYHIYVSMFGFEVP